MPHKAQTSGLVEIKNLGYFYYDNESNDCDKDGISDTQDYDADNDGYFNYIEALFGTDSLDALSNGISEDIIKMDDGSYTGIFITGGWSDEYLDFIDRARFKPAFIAVWANHWGNGNDFYYFDRSLCEWIIREKAIPFYIFGPDGRSMPPADSCSFLSSLCEVCGTVEFCDTVSAEQMNNQYGDPSVPDGPERVRDVFIHVVNLFNDAGIDNVMFTMHAAPYNDFGNWNRLSNYYPPQQYIDWHSTSAHFGVRQTGPLTLGQVIDETYEEMLEIYPLKPVFLVEFAVHSDSLGIEDMSAIINNAFCHAIPSDYPMIKGWTYVNSDRYGIDYKSTSLELDEERSNEFNQFVQCLEMNQDKYFENVQAYLVNSVQEDDNSLDNREEDWVLKVYPNPANPGNTICIKYCLVGSQEEEFKKNDYRVNLNIYNLLGRRVYRKAIKLDQGSIIWDANNQPSGVYIIRLEAGEATKQEKVIIIK